MFILLPLFQRKGLDIMAAAMQSVYSLVHRILLRQFIFEKKNHAVHNALKL
jgi:hypothetical protein